MAFDTAGKIANDSFFNVEDNHIKNARNENRGSFLGSVNQNVEEINTRVSKTQEKITESFFSKIGSFVEAGKEKIEEFLPKDIVQRTKGRVVESASQFIAGNPISELIGSLKATFGSNTFERLHNDLVDVVSQVKLTEEALEGNRTQLEKMSMEGNESAQELLKHMDDLERTELYDKILDRQKINSEEAGKVINSLKRVAENVSGVEKELSVSLPEILKNFNGVISDQRISEESRKKMLSNIQEYVKGLGLTGNKVNQFLEVNVDNFELNQENLSFVEDVFKEIKDDDIEDAKLRFSLEEISNKLDKSVLERGELTDLLEREEDEGETFEQKFLQNASLISAGKQISGGFGSALLGAVGLGALNIFGVGDILGEFVGGKIGGAFTKMLPKITSALGLKGLGVGGVIGKIAPILFIAKSLFDFGKGFLDAANISGIAEENLKFMDKVKAGISSFISGITFGLFIDPKETYDALFKTSLEDLENMLDLFWKDFSSIFSMDIVEIGGIVKDMAKDLFDKNPLIWLLDEGAQLIGFDEGVVSGKIRELASMAFSSIVSPMEALWDAGKALFDETDERGFLDKAWDVAKGIFNIHPLSMIFDFATDLLGWDEGAVTDKIKSIAESIFDFDPVGILLDYGKDLLGMDKEEKEGEIVDRGEGFFSGAKKTVGKTFDFLFGEDEEVEKGRIETSKSLSLRGESKLESVPIKINTIEQIDREKRRESKEIRREQNHREEQNNVIINNNNIIREEASPIPARTSVSDMDMGIVNNFLYR